MGLGGTILWILIIICAVWVIYDVWTNQKKMPQGTKILWSVGAIVLNIITAIVYYFVVKNK